MPHGLRFYLVLPVLALVMALALALQPPLARAQDSVAASAASGSVHDGQHDFDFQIGSWKTHVKRLVHPLTGSTTWVECDGISVVRKIWGGKANLVELEADCPGGHMELASWRLYNPESHQWSLNIASVKQGTLSNPTIGEFKNGRGEFYDQEPLNGRAILVHFVISQTNPNTCLVEQSFSDDGGKTWELNWVATDTRIPDQS